MEDQERRPGAGIKVNSKSGSGARPSSEDGVMAACPSTSGVRYSLAEEHKQPLDSAPTVGLGPSTTGAEQWTLLLPSKHDHQHEKGQLLDLTGNSTITVPNPEVRTSPAPSFRGERRHNRPGHVASTSFDATSTLDEFTSSLYGGRGAAVEVEHSSQRHVIRHGATSSFDANSPLKPTAGGGVNNNDGINTNPSFMTPSIPARPAVGPSTQAAGSARPALHHHGPSRSFDANANLQPNWDQLPLQTRYQPQDMAQRNLGAPGQSNPSPLLRQEQPWHQMQDSSRRMHNSDSIDRISGSGGSTSMDRYLHTGDRRYMPLEHNYESSPTDNKRKRLPYRCKKCGQMKNKHECPLKNAPVETRGTQTSRFPPGTVFEATDTPLHAENGQHVLCPRPYLASLHTHDEENGPHQYAMGATAASVARKLNTTRAVRERGRHWGAPEGSYSPSIPSNPLHGVSPATMRMGNAVGVVNSPPLGQEKRMMGNAVGVVNPRNLGQDDRLMYSGSGGGGGGGGSAQQGEEPWRRHGARRDGDRLGTADTGLAPPPSAAQRTSNYVAGANTTGMAGSSWPSSSGRSGPPGWQCTTGEEGQGAEGGLDFSVRGHPPPSSALSSTRSTPSMPLPPPGPGVDRWRRSSPPVQPPSSMEVALPPRLESIERMFFSEGYGAVSMEPTPAPGEEKGGEEGKEAEGGAEASSL